MLFSALALALVAGCVPKVHGSGTLVTRNLDLKRFNRLDVGHAFRVDVTRADSHSVSLHIDENLVQYLKVEVRDETLHLDLESGRTYSVEGGGMRVSVRMPEIKGLDASGAAAVDLKGFSGATALDLDLSGAASVTGEVRVARLRLEASGASRVVLRGATRELDADVSGASRIQLGDFQAENGRVDASGAAQATVSVRGRLEIDASGAADVAYLGHPGRSNVDTSGAASIRRL